MRICVKFSIQMQKIVGWLEQKKGGGEEENSCLVQILTQFFHVILFSLLVVYYYSRVPGGTVKSFLVLVIQYI